jgi:hypothetical protein
MSGVRAFPDGRVETYVDDRRTLAQAQADRIDALRTELLQQVAAGITHAGKPLQIDEPAQQRMAAVVTQVTAGVPLPPSFSWRMADNTFLALTGPQMIGMAAVAAARVYALRVAFWQATDAVRAATTREAADAVTAAWPA